MSYGDEEHSGIPTRAIHESYIEMQSALQKYRTAKDAQRQGPMTNAHGELQSGVLTFYELLRPHLKHESGVSDYWDGKLPSYRGNEPPDPDRGRGILQVQQATRAVGLDGVNTDRIETLRDWHDALELNGDIRLAGVSGMGDKAFLTIHQYQKGLRHLDDWETKYTRTRTKKAGFMSDKTTETVERQRIPIDRLKRAARELSDVADKLGALSDFNASEHRTEITEEQISRVEQWREENAQKR